MSWMIGLVLTLAGGWLLARALAAPLFGGFHPALRIPGEGALAILFGPGVVSVLWFALLLANLGTAATAFAAILIYTAACAGLWWRTRAAAVGGFTARGTFPWTWALAAALGLACVFLVLDFWTATEANPTGEVDAGSIWNLRARYLAAGGGLWRRAISPELGGSMLGASHPSYPLFLSSWIAVLWTVDGSYTRAVPIAVSLLTSIAVLALLVGATAARRGVAAGLLAGLILASTESFAAQMAAQYSDLLLALAFLAVLALLGGGPDPRTFFAAGLALGFAPWIKNEGIPFAAIAVATAGWRFRGRGLVWLLAGAAPGWLATASLKLQAQGGEAMFPSTAGEAIAKLADLSRWWEVAQGFLKAGAALGHWWSHPVLLLVLLVLVLRIAPGEQRRQQLWLAIPLIGTLAAEWFLYLITSAQLSWHIGTSVDRLVIQLWPAALWLVFTLLRTPDEYFALNAPAAASAEPATIRHGKRRAVR